MRKIDKGIYSSGIRFGCTGCGECCKARGGSESRSTAKIRAGQIVPCGDSRIVVQAAATAFNGNHGD